MKKSLLVLGKSGTIPYVDKVRQRFFSYAEKAGFDVQQADYHEIGTLRGFKNGTINIMFLFPTTFWDAEMETPRDTQLYGTSKKAYEKYSDYFLQVRARLEQRFRGHTLNYAIAPENAAFDLDKIDTVRRLRACMVPTPESLSYTSVNDLVDSITPERGIFIKCRYGNCGKGITVLHRGRWVTNYKVEQNGLGNHGVYDAWSFTDITGRRDLLEQLLQHEVIVEREIIVPNQYDGKKFDLRAYVVGGTVPHFFVRVNDPDKEVTNFAQGAKVIHNPHTGLTESCMRLISQIAKQAAEALGLRFVGIDFMFDKSMDQPKVVEMQVFTGFPDPYFNLCEYMISDRSGLFERSWRTQRKN